MNNFEIWFSRKISTVIHYYSPCDQRKKYLGGRLQETPDVIMPWLRQNELTQQQRNQYVPRTRSLVHSPSLAPAGLYLCWNFLCLYKHDKRNPNFLLYENYGPEFEPGSSPGTWTRCSIWYIIWNVCIFMRYLEFLWWFIIGVFILQAVIGIRLSDYRPVAKGCVNASCFACQCIWFHSQHECQCISR